MALVGSTFAKKVTQTRAGPRKTIDSSRIHPSRQGLFAAVAPKPLRPDEYPQETWRKKPPPPGAYDENGRRVVPNTAVASSRLYAQRRFDLCLRLLPQTLAAAGPAGTPRLAADPAFVWSAENWQAARSAEQHRARARAKGSSCSSRESLGQAEVRARYGGDMGEIEAQYEAEAPPDVPSPPRGDAAVRPGVISPAYEDDAELNAKLAATSMLLGMPPPHHRARSLRAHGESARVASDQMVSDQSHESPRVSSPRVAFYPPCFQDGGAGAAVQRPHTVAGGERPAAGAHEGGLDSARSAPGPPTKGVEVTPPSRPATRGAPAYLLPMRAAYVAEPSRGACLTSASPASSAAYPPSPAHTPASPTSPTLALANGGWASARDTRRLGQCEWPSSRFSDARPATTQPGPRASTPGYVPPKSARTRDTEGEGRALGVGRYRHWEHKEPFEVALEKEWRLEARLRAAGRPATYAATKRRPATRG